MKRKLSTLCLTLALIAPLGIIGCASDHHGRSTGQYIDDKSVSSRVRGALSNDPEFKFDDVEVKTYMGTVQLAGFVNTADQKQKAGQIAKHVQGVDEVVNNISVKESK